MALPGATPQERSRTAAGVETFSYDNHIVRAFAIATAIWGLVGTAAGLLLPLEPGRLWVRFDPWLMPFFARGDELLPLALGIGGGLLLAVLGCIDVTRKDVL